MKKQNIHQAYDSITLTQGEKDAMLEKSCPHPVIGLRKGNGP